MPGSYESWSMRFTVVPTAEAPRIVEARFRDVVLQDAADVEEWARRVDVELKRFGEQVDLLIDLEGLRVQPAASRRFGELRARILADHSRHSARYGPDRWTATSVNTSRACQSDPSARPRRARTGACAARADVRALHGRAECATVFTRREALRGTRPRPPRSRGAAR